MNKTIVNGDLIMELDEIKSSDNKEFYQVVESNRAYLRKWIAWVEKIISPEEAEKFINYVIDLGKCGKDDNAFIKYEGKIVGWIGYHHHDKVNKLLELHYWIIKKLSRQGNMTAVCKNLIQSLFKEQQLNKIEIHVSDGNTASHKLAKDKLGFTKEGMLREREFLHNHFVNHTVYGLLKREFEKLEIYNTEL